jgi:hypothetical protein
MLSLCYDLRHGAIKNANYKNWGDFEMDDLVRNFKVVVTWWVEICKSVTLQMYIRQCVNKR